MRPFYNEKPHLAEVFKRVIGQLAASPLVHANTSQKASITSVELICIDDFSKDGSREWLTELQTKFHEQYGSSLRVPCEYRLLLQEKNRGKGAAIRYGIDESKGDILLIQDADLEYSPSDYDALIQPFLNEEADAVYGSRFLGGAKVNWISYFQAFANLFLTWFFNFMSSTRITDVETCYKLMKGSVARSLRLGSDRFGIELELTARLSRIGARIREVPISYNPRTYAEGKKIGPSDGIAAIFHIVRYNVFDTHPYKSGAALKAFPLRPRLRTIALLVFGAALLLRLAFVAQWFKTPYAGSPLLDALSYDNWAQSILDGHFLREKAFYQSPLYPYFLAGVYKLFGHEFLVVSCVQAFLSALTCSLVAWVTVRHLGELSGFFAGMLAAFYRPLIFYSAPVMKETLSIFLLSLFLMFVINAFVSNRKRDYMAAGFALGLTALTRGNVLVVVPVVLLAALWRWRKEKLKTASLGVGIFTVCTFLAVAPATLHNWIASRDFVLLNYTSGFNFYMGNSSTTTGANAYPPEISSEPGKEELDVTRVAEAALGRTLSPSEVSSYWFNKGLEYVSQHPMEQVASFLNKLIYFWNDFEQPDNYDVTFVSENMGTLLGWPLVGFGLLATLSAFGLALSWSDTRGKRIPHLIFWMGAAYSTSILIYYVTDRYRLPFCGQFLSKAFPPHSSFYP